jgi:hypothetical protein
MAKDTKLGSGFGPKNEEERIIFAQEAFRVNMEAALYKAWEAAGQPNILQLAKAAGVNYLTVYSLFSEWSERRVMNISSVELSRLCFVLGVTPKLTLEPGTEF